MIIYEDLERLGTWAGSGSRSRSGSDAKPSIEEASKHVQDRAGGAELQTLVWPTTFLFRDRALSCFSLRENQLETQI